MALEEHPVREAPATAGTVMVIAAVQRRGSVIRVEPPDQPWQYAPLVERTEASGERCTAIVTGVPAGPCWVHLEGSTHENVRSAQVTVPAGDIVELDWRA